MGSVGSIPITVVICTYVQLYIAYITKSKRNMNENGVKKIILFNMFFFTLLLICTMGNIYSIIFEHNMHMRNEKFRCIYFFFFGRVNMKYIPKMLLSKTNGYVCFNFFPALPTLLNSLTLLGY